MSESLSFSSEDRNAIYQGLSDVLSEVDNFKKVTFQVEYKKQNDTVFISNENIPDVINRKAGIYILLRRIKN